jgi:thiol-disulfide isomerase/thioredoxin
MTMTTGTGTHAARWISMAATAAALALLMLPLGGDNGLIEPEEVAAAASATCDKKAKRAPLNYTIKDMNGDDVRLSSFKGKVIVLNFWATWCGPCKVEIPALVELQKQYANDVVVLGMSVDDPVDELKPFATKYKINYPVLVGLGREDVQDAFGPLYGIPVTVFIGRDGTICKTHHGIAAKGQIEGPIKALL